MRVLPTIAGLGAFEVASRGLALIWWLNWPWKTPIMVSDGSATTDSCEKRIRGVRKFSFASPSLTGNSPTLTCTGLPLTSAVA